MATTPSADGGRVVDRLQHRTSPDGAPGRVADGSGSVLLVRELRTATERSIQDQPDLSPREVEFDDQVRALLIRIDAQERQAQAAQAEVERIPPWPSWSMDTGLTEAQEIFVEAWSPQRVLDASRSVRQLVLVLQRWTRTHRDDADLNEALTILATLPGGSVNQTDSWPGNQGRVLRG